MNDRRVPDTISQAEDARADKAMRWAPTVAPDFAHGGTSMLKRSATPSPGHRFTMGRAPGGGIFQQVREIQQRSCNVTSDLIGRVDQLENTGMEVESRDRTTVINLLHRASAR